MSTAMPQIPPRPNRAHNQTNIGSTLGSEIPKIPPRPARRIERSVSPQRESFARSPLNEVPFSSNYGKQERPSPYANDSANTSSTELPNRPSSVSLPSIGQEGSEYADVFANQEELGSSPTQTRNVANNLKLHAPKPSLPVSSAKQRVSNVTRTDSGQAAAFGIGKPGSIHDDHDHVDRAVKSKASFTSSNGTERPSSILDNDHEHGIPHIGQYVPMYPNAGDVQAPSPAPFQQLSSPGIGFHNDGSALPRHHTRKTSARGTEIPHDAYGKHGHGQTPHDRFEKAYYQKHPELLKKETGHYHGPFAEGRAEWAMSSDDLNKIVRETASRGAGLGTSPAVIGTPSEQIGFQASEEYTSRMSSPKPVSSALHASHSESSQIHVDSPLGKESFGVEAMGNKAEFEGNLARGLQSPLENALESEVEDEDTIHVDAPRRSSRVYGGQGYLESTDSLGLVGEGDLHEEHGYSAPILASDEVAKEPFGWELQPAVSPMNDRRNSGYEESMFHPRSGSASSLGSRPSSRPGSIHGALPGFAVSSTTLEDLDEYEPLFPEDGQAAGGKKPLTAADKLKRPETKNRPSSKKFPSADIWEDSPNSLHYTATVSTPQLPEDTEEESKIKREQDKETPEQAFARRQEELAEAESQDSDSFLNREKKPWAHKSHLLAETRPSVKGRFPSRDIWEDTPDSHLLETTVAGPQSDDKDALSPPTERPTTGATVFHHELAASLAETGESLPSDFGRATTGIAAVMKPAVPARPVKAKPSESPEKSQPVVPERPLRTKQAESVAPPIPIKSKPVVPARPAKPITRDSSENIPLTTVKSNSSSKSVESDQGSVSAAKSKPPIPSRPAGSKIAALQGGFMSDLNKRLQLGPQAPKKEEAPSEEAEVEQEKTPLADARKGRARGPARRAPAKSPAPAAVAAATEKSLITCSMCVPSTLFSIDPEEELLHVPANKEESILSPETIEPETPSLATSTAGETVYEPSETPAPHSATEVAQPEKVEEPKKENLPISTHAKDEPTTTTEETPNKSALAPEPEENLSASIATLKAASDEVEE